LTSAVRQTYDDYLNANLTFAVADRTSFQDHLNSFDEALFKLQYSFGESYTSAEENAKILAGVSQSIADIQSDYDVTVTEKLRKLKENERTAWFGTVAGLGAAVVVFVLAWLCARDGLQVPTNPTIDLSASNAKSQWFPIVAKYLAREHFYARLRRW